MLSISEMNEITKSIYSKKNEEYDFEYMYGYLSRKVSYLSRGFLRRGEMNNEEVMSTFIQSLSWLFSICDKLEINPQDAFYKKFPKFCPYCLNQPCACTQTHRKPEKIKSAMYIKEELDNKYRGFVLGREKTIDPTTMINEIYPSNKNIWGIFGGFYHSSRLFEDLGELHEAYAKTKKDSNYNRENLSEECADIFAWLYSLWGINFRKENEELSIKFQEYYMNGCPACYKMECVCSPYGGKINTTEQKREALNELIEKIKELAEDSEFASYDADIKSIITSLNNAASTGIDIDGRRSFNEAESLIDKIDKTTSKGTSILSNVSKSLAIVKALFGL